MLGVHISLVITTFPPQVRIFGVTVLVAAWWLDAAARGIPPTIPVVNFNTVIVRGGGVDVQNDGHDDDTSILNNNDINESGNLISVMMPSTTMMINA